jgi:hypothetical protein
MVHNVRTVITFSGLKFRVNEDQIRIFGRFKNRDCHLVTLVFHSSHPFLFLTIFEASSSHLDLLTPQFLAGRNTIFQPPLQDDTGILGSLFPLGVCRIGFDHSTGTHVESCDLSFGSKLVKLNLEWRGKFRRGVNPSEMLRDEIGLEIRTAKTRRRSTKPKNGKDESD